MALERYGQPTTSTPSWLTQNKALLEAGRKASVTNKPARQKKRVVIPKAGDDFLSLADKYGVDPIDLQQANPDDSRVMAGAALNLPSKPLMSQVPYLDPRGNRPGGHWDPNARFDVTHIPEGGMQDFLDGDEEKREGVDVFKYIGNWLKNLGDGQGAWDAINWGDKKDDEIQSMNLGGKPMMSPAYQDPRANRPDSRAAYNTNPPPPNTMWGGGPTAEQQELDRKIRALVGEQTPEMFPQQYNYMNPAQSGPLRPSPAPAGTPQRGLSGDVYNQPNSMAYAYGFTDDPRNEMLDWARPGVTTSQQQAQADPRGNRPSNRLAYDTTADKGELQKLKIPQNPSAFEAVNWLTGAGLTGTALLSAGRQLRLDRPEYWDATGARGDVLEGMEKFLIAEFGNPDGTIDWAAAQAQDPYITETLDKLGYLDKFAGQVGGGGYYTPSYGRGGGGGGGGGGGYVSGQRTDYPAQLGLVSWSI